MSLSAVVPTSEGGIFRNHISAAPNVSTIFGHVRFAVQRSRIPLAGRPRPTSGYGVHHCVASRSAAYSRVAASGRPKRALSAIGPAAMIGHAPS